ncbi:Transposase IS4 [Popillia japonica]|uniref:Transposase IS4 n=1 Tax=Popillia japonica TaxID=7064 RepID=A0AAW1IYN5_POPJA
MLPEPDGTVLQILVYARTNDEEVAGKEDVSKVVMKIMEKRLNVGHSLYMDNFYNLYDLANTLLESNTYCTGTLRSNRIKHPIDVLSAKLKKGELNIQYCNNVAIMKWKDKSDVLFLTTEHFCKLQETCNRRGNVKEKLYPLTKYNENMGGIDLRDQMLYYYSSDPKTVRFISTYTIEFVLV